jgi:hypothetical protein
LLKIISWDDIKRLHIGDLVVGLAQDDPMHRRLYEHFVQMNFVNSGFENLFAKIAENKRISIITFDRLFDVIA